MRDETKIIPQTTLDYFCVHIVEHCNLKCQFCDHFSPLADDEFIDIKVFEKDFARLSELLDGKVNSIGLMGGEPLLNPQLNDFLSIARKYFPNTKLCLVTNGILLLKQTEDFWNTCKINNIVIVNTKYPIALNFERMKEVAKEHEVIFEHYGDSAEVLKTSSKMPLDLLGKQNPDTNFMGCYHANDRCFLSKGRLFPCTIAPNVWKFNKFFNQNLSISDEDYIDIYKAINEKEILNFLSKPIPFCKYCYVEKRTFGLPWKRSRKDIKEWIV